MRKSRFSDEQIIGMISDHESDVKTAELCRKNSISNTTFYKYKARFGGMTVSDGQRLLAELMLYIAALKDIASKNF